MEASNTFPPAQRSSASEVTAQGLDLGTRHAAVKFQKCAYGSTLGGGGSAPEANMTMLLLWEVGDRRCHAAAASAPTTRGSVNRGATYMPARPLPQPP